MHSLCRLVTIVLCAASAAFGENFVVTTTLVSGPGSLEHALSVAATNAPGDDVITFAIAGSPPFVIAATSTFPVMKGDTRIDATTQAGYSSNAPAVILNGAAISGAGTNGIVANGSGNVIRGLRIEQFSGSGIYMTSLFGSGQSNRVEACHLIDNGYYGVLIQSLSNSVIGGLNASNRNVVADNTFSAIAVSSSRGNLIAGNWVGVSATNSAVVVTGQGNGIDVVNSWENTIASSAAASQIIGGCASYGLRISGGGSNWVYGCYIGMDVNGTAALSNSTGVLINNSVGNRIGGTSATHRNYISGNIFYGMDLVQTSENIIEGNIIGAGPGTTRVPNNNGIRLQSDTVNNLIGGTSSGSFNLIAGNKSDGVSMYGRGNRLEGNRIGVAFDTLTVLSNGASGVYVSGTNNTVGGTSVGAGNVICGNGNIGVDLGEAVDCTVQGNFIGVSIFNVARPNRTGVRLLNARNCLIGGSGTTNIISGNLEYGINIHSAAAENRIEGNFIGTSSIGLVAVSNRFQGILAAGGTNNTIGGSEPGMRNVIAGNGGRNIELSPAARGYTIAGNYIGVGADGVTKFGNAINYPGILASGSDHLIGGTAPGAGNVISGNTGEGILIEFATNVTVQGNYIGLAANGTTFVNNGTNANNHGVRINPWSTRTLVGGTAEGARNVIVSSQSAVAINASSNNTVQGNFLGYTASGTSMVVQTKNGVEINPGAWNLIGGTNSGAGNVIYGINSAVAISTTNSHHNTIQGNIMNLDRFGNIATTNVKSGVVIVGGQSNLVGGAGASARNIILSGITASGVGIAVDLFETNTTGNIIQGNYIGVGPDGTSRRSLPNYGHGIYAFRANGNTIGGTNAGEGNVVAYCRQGIIIALNESVRNGIYGNTSYSNSISGVPSVGIELTAPAGSNPNDPAPDADVGPNNLQNYPVVTNAISFPGSTRISGRLASAPSSSFRIEFFYSDTTNAEGRAYLGAASLTTAANGTGTFNVILSGYAPTSKYITATATDANKNTSEFSPGAIKPSAALDTDSDGMPDYWESFYGLNPSFAGDATNSLDADGVSNRDEYLSGTIPNNANSFLYIDTLSVADEGMVGFPSSQFRNYNLEAANTVSNNTSWSALVTNVLGNGLMITLNDAAISTGRYYRVRSLIPQ